MIDNSLPGQLRHTHDTVSIIHSVLFNTINRRVHLAARTIEVCSMDMYAQRFSTDHLCMNTGRICKPVVSVDDVELTSTSHYACYNREVVDFVVEVMTITHIEMHTTNIIDRHIVKVGIYMISEVEVFLRRRCLKTIFHIIIFNIAISNWHLIHCNYIKELLFFS